MKSIILSLAAGSCFIVSALAVEPAAPTVKLVVKKHLLESEHDKGGKFGSSAAKTYALRVEVTNTGKTPLVGAEISGTALVHRARALADRVSAEPLSAVKVPDIKPNDKVTLELGRIDLHKLEMRQREMEESLEEWQVICTKGGSELGKEESSDRFETMNKDASGPSKKGKGGKGERKKK